MTDPASIPASSDPSPSTLPWWAIVAAFPFGAVSSLYALYYQHYIKRRLKTMNDDNIKISEARAKLHNAFSTASNLLVRKGDSARRTRSVLLTAARAQDEAMAAFQGLQDELEARRRQILSLERRAELAEATVETQRQAIEGARGEFATLLVHREFVEAWGACRHLLDRLLARTRP